MKKMKKLLSCLLVLSMLISITPMNKVIVKEQDIYGAEELTYESGNTIFKYHIVDGAPDEYWIEITKYEGTDRKVVIPEKIDGMEVKWLDWDAFSNNENIETIEIPKTVTNIEWGRSGQVAVTLQTQCCFYGCSNLKEVKIDTNNEFYVSDSGVIYDKAKKTLIRCVEGKNDDYIMPNGIEKIQSYAFYHSNIKKVSMPATVVELENLAFYNCVGLEEIDFSVSLTNINLSKCPKITKITVPNSVQVISISDCESLSEINTPASTTSISISGCKNLTKMVLPASLIYLSISECKNLSEINIPTSLQTLRLSGCDNISEIVIPNSVKVLSLVDCGGIAEINIPDSVTAIRVENCDGLRELQIPASVTSIGENAFSLCSSLKKIEFLGHIENVGKRAFYYCVDLQSVLFDDGCETIGEQAFMYCVDLKDINLGNSLKEIGYAAFLHCEDMTSIQLPDTLTKIGGYAFERCFKLEEIVIPSSVEEIGEGMLTDCKIVNVTVDNNDNFYVENDVLIDKNNGVIINCNLNKEGTYVVPGGINKIGAGAFSYCEKLTDIYMEEGVKEIGGYAFQGCTGLKNVLLADSVRTIWGYSFRGCTNLQKIYIPEGMLDIWGVAGGYFTSCPKLTIVGVKGSVAEKLAADYERPFMEVKEMETNNIAVIYSQEEDSTNVILKTREITLEDEEYRNIELQEKILDKNISYNDVRFVAYDISLVDENDNIIQPNGDVIVKIPCPGEYDGNNCNVYRINADGLLTDMKATYFDNHIVFTTNHFSTYILTETLLEAKEEVIYGDLNGDGDINTADAVLIKKYLAGYKDLDIDTDAADINADGNITSADAVILQKYLAGYKDVVLGN